MDSLRPPWVRERTFIHSSRDAEASDESRHCPAGMVFAINPPTSGNETYEAYKVRKHVPKLPLLIRKAQRL